MSGPAPFVLSSTPGDNLQRYNALKTQGFVVVDVLSREEVEKLSTGFYQLFSDKAATSGFHTTMATHEPAYREAVDTFIKSVMSPKVAEIMPGYRVLFSNFMHKPASSASEVGLHRDWEYVDESQYSSYNLWLPMVDISAENGSFYVLPGSHLIPHGPRATPFDNALKTFNNTIRKLAQPISLKAGQGILYHSGLIHFSGPNQSHEDRLAAGMVCVPAEAQIYHHHKDSSGKGYRRYHVDDSFYYSFDPQSLPSSAYTYDMVLQAEEEKNTGPWLLDYARKSGMATDLVAEYYDTTTEGYLQTYGEAIQAFRPKQLSDLYEYLISSIGINDGMKILDAGCGVGGPAIYFAKKRKVDITGYTISQKQVDIAKENIGKLWWKKGKVDVRLGDYHELSQLEGPETFDAVLFLESLGHSYDPRKVISEAYRVLKPDGIIYIKDFFPHEVADPDLTEKYRYVINRINDAYAYNVLDLITLIEALRQTGFMIGFIKKFDFADDISARAAFEELYGIDLFGDIPEFRVAEWLEIKCIKPGKE